MPGTTVGAGNGTVNKVDLVPIWSLQISGKDHHLRFPSFPCSWTLYFLNEFFHGAPRQKEVPNIPFNK